MQVRRAHSLLQMRQNRPDAEPANSTGADSPSPIWVEPGHIHTQIVDLLGVEEARTRQPGLRLTLPGDSDHEWQLAFDEYCVKMAAAVDSEELVAELVAREGNQLLIHTVPAKGWWLMQQFANAHEVHDMTHYLNAVDPDMMSRVDRFLEVASEGWDRLVDSQLRRDGALPAVSMDGFLPESLDQDVDKPEFDAWLTGIAGSGKSFYLAERHGNHGAQNLFIANASHFSGYELLTELFKVEDQPLIDLFMHGGSDADPHPLLSPMTHATAQAIEILRAAKQHGITVTGINSAAVNECRSPPDFQKRGRGMNLVAHDVISRRLRERDGPVIIHGGTGHGKLGHPDRDKPGVIGLAALQGWPTLLVEESRSSLMATHGGTFYFTVEEFNTDRLIDGPPEWASSKYDLRVWKKSGSWAAEAPAESEESEESTPEDDYEEPPVGSVPPDDGTIVEHKGNRFRWNDRLEGWDLLSKPGKSDGENFSDDEL